MGNYSVVNGKVHQRRLESDTALNAREISRRLNDMESALKVIRTWMACGGADPNQVRQLCDDALSHLRAR